MIRSNPRLVRASAYVLSVLIVAGTAELLFAIPVISPGAAAPVLLLAVLMIARSLGTGPALVGSSCAALAFSVYFLQPSGRLTEDLNDLLAFGTFALTAIIVGELAARAERRQVEAEQGRREIEQLYQQLESAFERASEAEAARRNEQLKSALLDALTHNLRTPLTAIKASVTALLGAGEPPAATSLSSDSRRDLLIVIDEESDRLNRFIEALSVADQRERSGPQSRAEVPAYQIVREAVARAETVARRHHLSVSVEPNLPPLAIDRAAIVEVLYILLDNASKYAPAGTTIRVRGAAVDEQHVRLTVEDEGPGIPADLREQVFRQFFRIPGRESIDPRRTGIGLGLSIARRLVESQSGGIAIETPATGRGTCVALTLPCAADGNALQQPEPPPALRT